MLEWFGRRARRVTEERMNSMNRLLLALLPFAPAARRGIVAAWIPTTC